MTVDQSPLSRAPRIRVLSDGRPGHENQSVGLALALERRCGATQELVKLDPQAPLWTRMRAASATGVVQGEDARATPDLVIATGHRTHLPLWWAARRLGARSIVIMRPSLPAFCFDLVIAPRHDFPSAAVDGPRRLLTHGALNRVPEDLPPKEARGLVLLGGPSRHHGWDGARLAGMIAQVLSTRPDLAWVVADSRRTPAGYLAELQPPPGLRVEKVGHAGTAPGWLAGELARASVVWVTADSVSMAHEAVTAGACTGVLPVPAAGGGGGGRPARAVAGLIAAGLVAEFPGTPPRPSRPFNEAGRCAEWILARGILTTKRKHPR